MYEIEWSEEAKADIRRISAFLRRPVLAAIENLRIQAENEIRNRKRLRHPIDDLPRRLGRFASTITERSIESTTGRLHGFFGLSSRGPIPRGQRC
jgi:hypothetical protein